MIIKKPRPVRTASFILISSVAVPFWSAIIIFLVIVISLNYSNHCYCQLSPEATIRGQSFTGTISGLGIGDGEPQRRLHEQQQQRQRPPAGGFQRQRRADLVQQIESGHMTIGRSLARAAALTAPEPRQQHAQEVMPYKTSVYVTQACEWKSNLFVPKSNDIHFAQQPQQQQQQLQQQLQLQQPSQTLLDQTPDEPDSRTILSTSQRALVLALPISLGQNFAGYEPACSIRLIVPRNMRILAKLTARRLTFEQEQFVPMQQAYPFGSVPGSFGAAEPNPGARVSQLWLNVSQNQFSETEQKIIETEGNVLAFRFLLERFANKQVPEIRFQVVLTAFQTLAENSDFNQPTSSVAWQPNQGFAPPDGPQQNAQFICDSQRLISANLACDGFKNCQDGHDEEPATCLALRNQPTAATGHTILSGPATSNELPARNQQDGSARPSDGSDQQRPWLMQLSNYLTRDLAGFLVGLLLLLLLLVCCACCCHCLFLLLRQLTEGQSGEDAADHLSGSSRGRRLRRRLAALQLLGGGGARSGRSTAMARRGRVELGESDSLARGQNIENAARLKERSLLEPTPDQPLVGQPMRQQQQQQQQQRIQSILKRPSSEYKGAPLARFEAIPTGQSGLEYVQQQQQPPPPPPRTPSRYAAGGAMQPQQQQQQAPSPRRGALASSMTSASRSSGRFTSALGEFRPTPAARATAPRPRLPYEDHPQAATSQQRQQQQQQKQPQVPFHRSQQPEARRGPTGDDDQGRRALVVRAQSPSVELPPPPTASDSDRLKFKSKTTKLEQTSTVTGSERVTVYQYSSNLAQFSESYLMKQGESPTSSARHHLEKAISSSSLTTTTTKAGAHPRPPPPPSTSGGNDDDDGDGDSTKPPELPPKTRQSSLI